MPLTGEELINSIGRILSLKNGIFVLEEDNNFYCINILYRACIESFLKAFYIWLKAIQAKDDSFIIKYREINLIKEYITPLHKELKKVGLSRRKTYQALQEKDPLLKKYNFDDFSKYESQFTYTHIIEELSLFLGSKDIPVHFLHTILSEYDELSSFVHGGTTSIIETTNFFKHLEDTHNGAEVNEIKNKIKMSVLMFMQLWTLILIVLYQKEKNEQIAKFYNNTNKMIKKLSALS